MNPQHKRALSLLLCGAAVLALNGCASPGVKPWERDLMARDAMQWDADGVSSSLDDHIYFSKEASSGGRSFGGGGCGCN